MENDELKILEIRLRVLELVKEFSFDALDLLKNANRIMNFLVPEDPR